MWCTGVLALGLTLSPHYREESRLRVSDMDDPPITLGLHELRYDDIVAEFASWQQFVAMQFGYVEQRISSVEPGEDVQTYRNEPGASRDVQYHSTNHDVEGFEMLGLLVSIICGQQLGGVLTITCCSE